MTGNRAAGRRPFSVISRLTQRDTGQGAVVPGRDASWLLLGHSYQSGRFFDGRPGVAPSALMMNRVHAETPEES
jgi:hypothetical protein